MINWFITSITSINYSLWIIDCSSSFFSSFFPSEAARNWANFRQWVDKKGNNLHRKPARFSHEDHGSFRVIFSPKNHKKPINSFPPSHHGPTCRLSGSGQQHPWRWLQRLRRRQCPGPRPPGPRRPRHHGDMAPRLQTRGMLGKIWCFGGRKSDVLGWFFPRYMEN